MARPADRIRKVKLPFLQKLPALFLPELARWTTEESLALSDEESPFSGKVMEGDPRVLLIVGENASGKSLAFRLIAQIASQHKVHAITLSIRERTGGGSFEMANMRRAMIYGDEGTSSTGATSASVVERGFANLSGKGPSLLCLDEPEIGLSEGYCEALGEYIGQKSRDMPSEACGVIVVTHSRRLAKGLAAGIGGAPSFLFMSGRDEVAPSGFSDWLESHDKKTVEELMALKDVGVERFRAVQKLINQK